MIVSKYRKTLYIVKQESAIGV